MKKALVIVWLGVGIAIIVFWISYW